MWTPRRLLLLIVMLAAFAGLFYAYNVSELGGIDGLPQLPAEYQTPADDASAPPIPEGATPTILQLQRAFGPKAEEVTDSLAYKFKFLDAERGLAFAGGQAAFTEGSPFVTVSPFSIAFFADAAKKVRHPDGEVEEITTFHADRCRLQFDQPVAGFQDLYGDKLGRDKDGKDRKAPRLVGLELLSDPDLPTIDPRRGRVWVTNNQRSADPNDRLLFRTPGPLFYQAADADPAKPAPPDAPQVWTTAFVEVIDGRNLPRPLPPGTDALPVIPADALRQRGVVADMVAGASLPPPTMSATGLKVYLKPQAGQPAKDKRNSSGYSGVRRIELSERVQVNLWTDGSAGTPGSGPPSQPAPKPAPVPLAPLAGGLYDGATAARRLADRALLVIDTSGPFRYDFEANTARFEVAPTPADPSRPNVVAVARIAAAGRQDDLVCTLLTVDFFGGPDKDKAAGPKGQGMSVKGLTATGPHVYLSVEAEGFTAQGTSLNYRTDPAARATTTVLQGSPVVAKKDRNRLEGGSADRPAEIVLTTQDPPPAKPNEKPGEKVSLVEVRGPGRMALFDPKTNETSLSASWKTALIQQKDTVGTQVQDLLRFEGGGEFRDVKADFRLTADLLKLWVAPTAGRPAGNNALPQRLLAVQNVRSRSPELEIGMDGQPPVDQLTVWFRDGQPPPAGAPAAQPLLPLPAAPQPQVAAATPPAAPPPAAGNEPRQPAAVPARPAEPAVAAKPEPKKPPVLLSARAVESWVVRYPVADPAAKAGDPPALKYEMERARCEDRVVVHQEPADPAKTPRGLDVAGQTLNLTQSRAGSVMVVTGTPNTKAEVHFETTSITGPTVKIDQPNNAVEVTGAGTLRMPSQNEVGGQPAARPTELEVTWATEMRFEGSNALAEFIGAVKAVQTPDRGTFRPKAAVPPPAPRGAVALRAAQPTPPVPPADPTWSRTALFCHRLDVGFDRPVYFSQTRRTGGDRTGGAKLRRAVCTPRPEEEIRAAGGGATDRTVVYLEETLDRATRKLTKAQRIECRELEMLNDDARQEQQVYAAGEGEVRILQAGAKDDTVQPTVAAPAGRPAAGQELKLTWVKFHTRMVGVDKGKLFQQATFADGAQVWQTPTDDLNLVFEPFARPPNTVHLTCTDKLEVTSERRQPGGPADQRLLAVGSAEAESDDYKGSGPTIRYQGENVIFEGTESNQASFHRNRQAVGRGGDSHRAAKITYNRRNRQVYAEKSTTGQFAPGGR